ncbi:MAG: ComF family protein [Alphaproteobacteria bacterium]
MKLSSLCQHVIDSLLPPRCLRCGENVSTSHTLCSGCWARLTFISAPQCCLCGWPFAFAADDQYICGSCLRKPPLFTKATAVFRYDEGIKPLILRFKHGDALDLSPRLSLWMAEAGKKADLFSSITALVPVPLHWRRLFMRRYNQASVLAQAIARTVDIPCHTSWLRRKKATPPQGSGSKKQRFTNVRGAFRVPPSKKDAVQGSRILLIDDVFTTGATLTECAKVLLKQGAAEVRVLTLARVSRL